MWGYIVDRALIAPRWASSHNMAGLPVGRQVEAYFCGRNAVLFCKNMKSRIQKKEELKALVSKLPESQITVFTSFARDGEKGLSVAQMTELKRALRVAHSEYVVTKKTIINRVMEGKDIDIYGMQGSLGLVVGNEEPYSIAKKVYDFAKKNPALQFFGALLDGGFITKEQFVEMAKMPSQEALIGRLFGMMKYPITSLAIVMSEIAKKSRSGIAEELAIQAAEPVETPIVPVIETPAESVEAGEVNQNN